MPNAYYEIVELANGEIALQRVDGEGESLVRVCFSEEVKFYLQEQYLDVAKAMINTGIRIVGQLQEQDERLEDFEDGFDDGADEGSDGGPEQEYSEIHTLH